MNQFSTQFLNRTNTERPFWPWQEVSVTNYSWAAWGGPKLAKLVAYGTPLTLWEFMEMLRCPVIIRHTPRAKAVWWGHVSQVTITIPPIQIMATIDEMFNNVAVAYTNATERYTTSWSLDTPSSVEYGTKDLLLSANDRTDTEAQNYRDTTLARRKYPQVSPPLAATGLPHAEILCRGWWDTLDWRYYAQDDGFEAYEEINGFIGREIGEDDRPICAQSFKNNANANWAAYKIGLRVRKEGSPVDNLRVDLCVSTLGSPGASQAYGTVSGANVGEALEWTEFTLDTPVTLTAGSTYWIKIMRSGAVSETDYYMIGGNDTEGYTDGVLKLWYGTYWDTWEGQPCDLNFRVIGAQETSSQIATIVTDIGQFFAGTDIVDASGITRNQYRYGDTTGLFEIKRLLEIGTSNNRRMLAKVTENRYLQIYEEPALWEADYSLDAFGSLKDQNGALVDPSDCPVGMWLRFENVIPASVDTSRLNNAGFVFVEEAEYSVANNLYRIAMTRDVDILRDLFGVKDG